MFVAKLLGVQLCVIAVTPLLIFAIPVAGVVYTIRNSRYCKT